MGRSRQQLKNTEDSNSEFYFIRSLNQYSIPGVLGMMKFSSEFLELFKKSSAIFIVSIPGVSHVT